MNTLTKTSDSCPKYQPKIFTLKSNKELKIAVNKWIIDKDNAIEIYGDINEWNTENITDMSYLFCEATLFNDNISNWNTLNVINMNYMFCNARTFNQDLNNWDVSNVKSIESMFCNCINFNIELRWQINITKPQEHVFHNTRSTNQYICRIIEKNIKNIENNKICCCIIA